MTHDRRTQVRAVFLAAIMVTSVVGVSVAFTGSAAAAVTQGPTVTSNGPFQTSDSIDYQFTPNDGSTVVKVWVDEDTDDQYDAGESTTKTAIGTSSLVSGQQFSNSLSLSGVGDGTVQLAVKQTASTLSGGDSAGATSSTFQVDSSSPGTVTIDSPTSTTDASAGSTVDVQYDAGDSETSVADVTLKITDNNGNTINERTGLSAGTDVQSEITVPGGTSAGQYNVKLEVTDAAGNTGSASQSNVVKVDNTAPTLDSATPSDGSTITSATKKIDVAFTEGGSGIDNDRTEVTVTNDGETIVDQIDVQGSNGVSIGSGTISVDASNSNIPNFVPGNLDISVTAVDNAGNQNSKTFSYTVDTSTPTITLTQPTASSTVTDDGQTIQVQIADAESDVNDGSTEVRVRTDAPTELFSDDSSPTNSEAISYDSATNTYTITPSTSTRLLPDDTIEVAVNANDGQGNSLTGFSTFRSFEVDLNGPTESSLTIDGAATPTIKDSDADQNVPVVAVFNEPVDAGSVRAELSAGGQTITIGDSDDQFNQNNGADDDDQLDEEDPNDPSRVRAFVDLSGLNVDTDSATLKLTQATDDHGNTKSSGYSANTFTIDTEGPTIQEDPNNPLQDPVSGFINLENHFTASGLEGSSLSFSHDANQDGSFTAIGSPADFDTTTISEGPVDFQVTGSDDESQSDTATVTVTVDNTDPSISTSNDQPLTSSSYDISTAFTSVSGIGSHVITYEYRVGDTGSFQTVSGGGTTLDLTQFADDTDLTFRATLPDPDGDVTQTVTSNVQQSEGVTVTDDGNDGQLELEITSNEDLDELSVQITNGNYHKDYSRSLSLDDFTESTSRTDEDDEPDKYVYAFSSSSSVPFDGQYTAAVQSSSQTGSPGSSYLGGPSSSVSVDTTDPSIDQAELVDSNATDTALTVELSEPIASGPKQNLDAGNFTWSGAAASVSSVQNVDTDAGTATVILDEPEVQTGTSETLNFSNSDDVVEKFGDNSDNNLGGTTGADAKFEFTVSDGVNVVSIPAETGSVDLTSVDLPSEIDTIATYDESSDNFQTYTNTPDASNDITTMRGGVGYVVGASGSAAVDVEVENRPVGSTVAPDTADVQPGYNLLGAFQEGDQPTEQAFATLNNQDYSVEEGYTGNTVTTVNPGQGYWVFADSSDFTKPVSFNGLTSDRPTIAAIDTEVKTENADAGFSQTDEIRVYATVSDDSQVDSVTLDNSNIGNLSDVKLTDADNDGQFDKTFDGTTNGELDFTSGVTAGVTETLTVEAVDDDGNLAGDTGETRAIESGSPTIDTITYENNEGTDSDIDTAVLTFDEEIDSSTVDAGDYTIDQGGQNVQADTIVDATADDKTFKVKITGDDSGIGTGTPQVSYTAGAAGSASTADFAGNTLADTTDLNSEASTVTDSIAPEIISVTTFDTNGDGSVDAANLTASEPIQTSGLGSSSDYELAGNDVDSVNADEYSDQDGSTSDDSNSEFRIDYSSVSGTEAKEVNYDGSGVTDGNGNALIELTDNDVSEIDGADPEATGAVYKDTNDDGSVEDVEVTFSEDLDTSTANIDAADFVFSGGDIGAPADGVNGISSSVVTLDVSSAASGQGTDLSGPSLAYTADSAAGSNSDPLEDADSPGTDDANEVEDFSGLSVDDSANPAIIDAERQGSGTGSETNVDLVFSEAVTVNGNAGLGGAESGSDSGIDFTENSGDGDSTTVSGVTHTDSDKTAVVTLSNTNYDISTTDADADKLTLKTEVIGVNGNALTTGADEAIDDSDVQPPNGD